MADPAPGEGRRFRAGVSSLEPMSGADMLSVGNPAESKLRHGPYLPDNEPKSSERTIRTMPVLSREEIKSRLRKIEGWEFDDGELERKYRFRDFAESMAFVNRVAGIAETADHHPDISIKYNRVKLTLSTHSEGGVTEKDFALIAQIDAPNDAPAASARGANRGE